MSAIIFMSKSSRENGRKMVSGQVGHSRRQQNGVLGTKRNNQRKTPHRAVVTQQPAPATAVNMETSRVQATQMHPTEAPPSYFCLTIVCFFCCPIIAAFALFFSSQVKPNHSRGNYVGAKWSSRFTVLFCILALLTAVGIAVYFLYIFGVSSTSEAQDILTTWWHSQFPVE